jgi:hypothetical protein
MRVLGVFAMLTESFRRVSERARELTDGPRDESVVRATGPSRGMFASKPRRVTAVSQRDSAERSKNLRIIVIGTLCIMALVAFAYVLSPSGDEPIPHRDVRADQTDGLTQPASETETSAAAALSAGPAQEAAHEPGSSAAASVEKPAPGRLAGSAAEKPAKAAGAASAAATSTKPAASANVSAKPNAAVSGKTAAPGNSMVFGQKQVPNARRFLLRMAEPVRAIFGTADAGGFSVVIMGNKALDRAAPIAVGNPSVEQAAILNRRDHSAELSVRFAPGKSPAYRVSGQGSNLEVLLEQ